MGRTQPRRPRPLNGSKSNYESTGTIDHETYYMFVSNCAVDWMSITNHLIAQLTGVVD